MQINAFSNAYSIIDSITKHLTQLPTYKYHCKYSTDLTQRRTRPQSQICSWLNNRPKKGVTPVSLADIMKHTQGCTLTSKTGATPPSSAIIKPQANPRAQVNATLRVICTVQPITLFCPFCTIQFGYYFHMCDRICENRT